jgi:tetratricopeptide (TPR) repeat protein
MKLALALGALLAVTPTIGGRNPTFIGVGYICSAENALAATPLAPGVMLSGMGTSLITADTQVPEAQRWFDYGVKAYHAFLHADAKSALAKAAALDPACAMCAWGVALSLGSTLNYAVTPQQTAEALAAADKAAKLVKPDDARTVQLIAALQLRYRAEAPPEGREVAYGKAMDTLARRYPADDAIATLAAHALIIPARQSDYSGVPRAREILETVLARRPEETAAIHYYIHATEFAGQAPLALPYAQKLASLAPGAGHMVHMGTHTLMRVGLYQDVALTNAEAMKVDAETGSAKNATGNLPGQMYYLHNYMFGLSGALMAGDAALALKYADHAEVGFRDGAAPQRRNVAKARSLVALGRFAPDRALAVAEATGDALIVRIYRHYARGEAFAARGDSAAVAREAEAVAALNAEAVKASDAQSAQVAEVAGGVLAGRDALLKGQANAAVTHFAQAAIAQEKHFPVLKNFDPPPWWYPVRRSLAAAQLKAGRYAEAEREAQASLAGWPNDALALRILAEAEARQGRKGAARDHLALARKVWRGDLGAVPMDLS